LHSLYYKTEALASKNVHEWDIYVEYVASSPPSFQTAPVAVGIATFNV
jgi:hypothetical protein